VCRASWRGDRSCGDRDLGHDRDAALRGVLRRPPVIDVEAAASRSRCVTGVHGGDARLPRAEAVAAALEELRTDSRGSTRRLVFLPGERQMRGPRAARARWRLGWDVFPLYARLSAAEQERVFEPHPRPRAVLATTSRDLAHHPGVRFVVDTASHASAATAARQVPAVPIEPGRGRAPSSARPLRRVARASAYAVFEDDFSRGPSNGPRSCAPTSEPDLQMTRSPRWPEDFRSSTRPTPGCSTTATPAPELGAVDGDRRSPPRAQMARCRRPAARAHTRRGGPAALPRRGAGDRRIPEHTDRASGRRSALVRPTSACEVR